MQTLEQARVLYQGSLLTGEHVEQYPWLETRDTDGVTLREYYQDAYYRLVKQLAHLRAQHGQVEVAIELCRSLLKVEPTLEDVVRDLYTYHGMAGDRAALLREDRQLRERLRTAYGDDESDPAVIEPVAETVAHFLAIKAQLEHCYQKAPASAARSTDGAMQG